MADNFLAGESSLWVQPDGPNTLPRYLGCHSIGDIPSPKGDSTNLYCPDPSKVGKFSLKRQFRGEPGVITTTIETDLRKTADYLEDLAENGCKFPIFIHKVSCGRRDVFSNYDRSFVLSGVEITNHTIGNLAAKNPGDEGESTQTFDLSILEVLRIFDLEASRVAIAETEDISGIAICGEQRCEGDCGAGMAADDSIFAVTNHLSTSASNVANVLHAEDGGAFTATAADPFAGGEDISGAVCFQMSRDVTRIVVARGTTDAANPAEVAYSDDGGATWTLADVGSTNGEYVPSSNSLFALDRYHIWLGTDLGRIYFSSDAGVTWEVQEAALISATDVMAINMFDTQVGFAVYTGGEVAKTIDGGDTWSQVTDSGSADATDIHALTKYLVWVVGADGMFYSFDAGATFATRNSYNVAAVDFLNEMFGIAVSGATSGNIWVTINGGYDWTALTALANAGYTDVKVISTKLAYVSGLISGGTGFVGKISPAV